MPTDEQGFKADIIINPAATIARMNYGQEYEQAINRASEFVRARVRDMSSIDMMNAFDVLTDYYNDINPNYAKLIRDIKNTPVLKTQHVQDVITNGIYLNIPPSLNTIGPDLINLLCSKWGVIISPVTFTKRDYDNNVVGKFTTNSPVCIGSKYLYLLSKIPEPSSSGISHVSQYNTPMKSTFHSRFPIRANPMRFGEDEVRIMSMDLQDPSEHMRLTCLQANSPKGVEATIDALLNSPYPTRIDRVDVGGNNLAESNDILARSNTVVALLWHQMETMGIDSVTKTDLPMPSAHAHNKTDDK